MRRSRRHDATARTGHSRPTATSAGRTPDRSTSSDAAIAPTPMDSATRLSSTPKTRASTSSGASLASSVKPPRSISALPTPTQASRPSAAACCGKTPISVTGTPHRATPTANQAPSRRVSTSSDAASEPEHRTRPDGGGEDADARLAGPQQVDGDHDGEHGQRAAGERLRGGQPHDQGEVAVPADGADALGRRAEQAGLGRRGGTRRRVVAQPQQQGRGPQRGARGHREHDGHAR